MKYLKDKLSRAVEGGDSLAAEQAKEDLEREASERYKGFVVRSRLEKVPNETETQRICSRGIVSRVPVSVY